MRRSYELEVDFVQERKLAKGVAIWKNIALNLYDFRVVDRRTRERLSHANPILELKRVHVRLAQLLIVSSMTNGGLVEPPFKVMLVPNKFALFSCSSVRLR